MLIETVDYRSCYNMLNFKYLINNIKNISKQKKVCSYRFNNSTLIKKSYWINRMQHHEECRHQKLISHNIPAFLPPSVLLRRKEEPDAISEIPLLYWGIHTTLYRETRILFSV